MRKKILLLLAVLFLVGSSHQPVWGGPQEHGRDPGNPTKRAHHQCLKKGFKKGSKEFKNCMKGKKKEMKKKKLKKEGGKKQRQKKK